MRGEGEIVNAGGELARGRLALYSRLAELVLEQEAALESEDLDHFNELTGMVRAIQERLGSSAGGEEAAGHRDEAARLLRVTLARSQRIQTRLSALRREAGGDIRNLEAGRNSGRRYLEASGPGATAPGPKVDVKF